MFRDGRVLIVRRARPPAHGLYTLPGGGVEVGETLEQAVIREIREETALEIEPVDLVGFRQAIAHDTAGRVERHFVILPFRRALDRRRDCAQRRIGRSALAGAARNFRTEDNRGLGRRSSLLQPSGSPGLYNARLNHAALPCLP